MSKLIVSLLAVSVSILALACGPGGMPEAPKAPEVPGAVPSGVPDAPKAPDAPAKPKAP